MSPEQRQALADASTQCDRAIIRLTVKPPHKTNLEDIGYVTASLAQARDALTWAIKQASEKGSEANR